MHRCFETPRSRAALVSGPHASIAGPISIEEVIETSRAVLALNDRGDHTVPNDQLYPADWLWDAGFISLGIAVFDPVRALIELETVARGQWPNGMLPHIVFLDDDPTYFPGPSDWGTSHQPPTSGITQPPIFGSALSILAEHHQQTSPFATRLEALWRTAVESHRWWYEHRDPDRTGVVSIVHPWESGMDNAPSWDEPLGRVSVENLPPYRRRDLDVTKASDRPTQFDYDRYWSLVVAGRAVEWDAAKLWETCEFRVADPLTNAILVRSSADLAVLGRTFGFEPDWCDELDAMVTLGTRGLELLWDADVGHYRSIDRNAGGSFVGPPTVASLMTPWSGVVPRERVAHLAAEARRWAQLAGHAIPSVDPQFEGFDPGRYWRGAVWINTNWLAAAGFARSGDTATAEWLKAESVKLVAANGCSEYFNPVDGSGHGGTAFSWTAALMVRWLES